MQFQKFVVIMAFALFLCPSLNGFSENKYLIASMDMVDFGTIEEGSPAATTVTIQNTGTAPVEITNVRTN